MPLSVPCKCKPFVIGFNGVMAVDIILILKMNSPHLQGFEKHL